MTQLVVETEAGNRTICRLKGEFDILGAQLLRRAAAKFIPTGGVVVVDLSDVTFIDSTGVSALVGLARRCREHGGSARLVGPRRSVARVLDMTGAGALLGRSPEHPSLTHHASLLDH